MAWVCSNCGATGVAVDESFAQIDPRYTTGHCLVCTPWPHLRKLKTARRGADGQVITHEQPPRRTIQLVRADAWDPDELRRRRERQQRVALASKLDISKKPRSMSDAEREAAAQALAFQLGED